MSTALIKNFLSFSEPSEPLLFKNTPQSAAFWQVLALQQTGSEDRSNTTKRGGGTESVTLEHIKIQKGLKLISSELPPKGMLQMVYPVEVIAITSKRIGAL
jgi:hypothetical protein